MWKNKLCWGILLLLAGWLAVLYNSYLTGVLFGTLVFFVLLLFLYARLGSLFLRVRLSAKETLVKKGEPMRLGISLRSYFPLSMSCVCIRLFFKNRLDGVVKKQLLHQSVRAFGKQEIVLNAASEYTGIVQFHADRYFLYDYFYLFKAGKRLRQTVSFVVLPNLYPMEGEVIPTNHRVLPDGETFSKTHPGEDAAELFGIREYREGDKMNRVHWKLSEKQEELMIKEFSDPIDNGTVLFLDCTCAGREKAALDVLDALLETVFSLSAHLLSQGREHRLVWYQSEQKHYTELLLTKESEMYEAMSCIMNEIGKGAAQPSCLLYGAEYGQETISNLVYITAELTGKGAEEYALLAARAGHYLIEVTKELSDTLSCSEEALLALGIERRVVQTGKQEEDIKHLTFLEKKE